MPNENRYFIAVIPPEDISAEITAIKHEIASVYNTEKVLKVMPHITLKAPFVINAKRDTEVVQWFINIETNVTPFETILNGFGAFDNPKNPVIFVKPEASVAMYTLQKDVLNSFKAHFADIPVHFHEVAFHPHITIGYRDLAYDEFEKAWAVFKNREYRANFTLHNFCLLKHNGNHWEVIYTNNLLNSR